MKTYEAGHFRVVIAISGAGPFLAEGFIQPYGSMETLQTVRARGETELEAESAVRKLADSAAAEMVFEKRYRRHVD